MAELPLHFVRAVLVFGLLVATGWSPVVSAQETAGEPPDYVRDIAPLFRKYCAGCHNAQDREGGLSLDSYAALQQGGKRGASLLPGQPESSRLLRVLNGQAEPAMPPEGSDGPNQEELARIAAWIAAGAKGPAGAEPDRTRLMVPHITPAAQEALAITAAAWSPDGAVIAVGRFRTVALLDANTLAPLRAIDDLPGKVNGVSFSADGRQLLVASGIGGLYGEASLWNVADGALVRRITGHHDTLYAAILSPDGRRVATASYDQSIGVWEAGTGEAVRTLKGHNGAVFDLAFDPTGQLLASASADETGKIWNVELGERLDTLGQPEDEQYTTCFDPAGQRVLVAGADNRIRVYRLVSRNKARINPLLYSRFAHEAPIIRAAYSPDGRWLVTLADDRSVKLWNAKDVTQVKQYPQQPDAAAALTMSPDSRHFAIGRMDGSLEVYSLPETTLASQSTTRPVGPVTLTETVAASVAEAMQEFAEVEPNDQIAQAQPVQLPAVVSGTIFHPNGQTGQRADVDLVRATFRAGQPWIIEVDAARSKSPLDSKIEVLNAQGEPVQRLLLRAVRDSYFTFRGKDSDISDDFRIHNWQEMDLNQYLYARGEVVKLWLRPRGPDSGFKVYPGQGNRYSYFGTTPGAHALGEPCYIVEPYLPDAEFIPNGLPVFPLYYENDDDGWRKLGKDSRLLFQAPSDGEYIIRVRDVRGYQGEDYSYRLKIRPPQPDFSVTLSVKQTKIPRGAGRQFRVEVDRQDDFDGPIRVEVANVPAGLRISSPIIIEAGQLDAYGVIAARPTAQPLTDEQLKQIKFTASAEIGDKTITHDVKGPDKLEIAGFPKLFVTVLPTDAAQHPSMSKSSVSAAEPPADRPAVARTPAEIHAQWQAWDQELQRPVELTIAPGETISAIVRVDRNGHDDRVSFGNFPGFNLPHGIIVDNIGLNGLLVPEGTTHRQFFITAEDFVGEMTREFHLEASDDGGVTSWPIILHVRKPGQLAEK